MRFDTQQIIDIYLSQNIWVAIKHLPADWQCRRGRSR